MSNLIPPDFDRCQTFISDLGGAFQFGLSEPRQCTKAPVYLLREESGEDGQKGEMTVCAACYLKFSTSEKSDTVTVHVIKNGKVI